MGFLQLCPQPRVITGTIKIITLFRGYNPLERNLPRLNFLESARPCSADDELKCEHWVKFDR